MKLVFVVFLLLSGLAKSAPFKESQILEAPYSLISRPIILENGKIVLANEPNHFTPGGKIIGFDVDGGSWFGMDSSSGFNSTDGQNPVALGWNRFLALSNEGDAFLFAGQFLEEKMDFRSYGAGVISTPIRMRRGVLLPLIDGVSESWNLLRLNGLWQLKGVLHYSTIQVGFRYFEDPDILTVTTNTRMEIYDGRLNKIGSADLAGSSCFPMASEPSGGILVSCLDKRAFLFLPDGHLQATYEGDSLLEYLVPRSDGTVLASDNEAGKLFVFEKSGRKLGEVKLGESVVNRLDLFPDGTIATEVWTTSGVHTKSELVTVNPDLTVRGRCLLGNIDARHYKKTKVEKGFITEDSIFAQTYNYSGNQYFILNKDAEKLFESKVYPKRYFHDPVKWDDNTLLVSSGGDGWEENEAGEPRGIVLKVEMGN